MGCAISLLRYLVVIGMLIVLALSSTANATENRAAKPNVIVIMSDDIGFECYSKYGSEFYHTPNIDSLARTGAQFIQAYSQPTLHTLAGQDHDGPLQLSQLRQFRDTGFDSTDFCNHGQSQWL